MTSGADRRDLGDPRGSRGRWSSTAIALVVGGALLVVLMVWGFVRGRAGGDADDEDKPVAQPLRVHQVNGQIAVQMDSISRVRAGIVVAPAERSTGGGATGYGSVVPLDTLSALHNEYVAAQTAVQQATARYDASRREYERLAALERDGQNAAPKAVEAARAAMLVDQAAVDAAAAPLGALAATARQNWGPVLGAWITSGSAEFDRLLSGREVLVQLSVPAGSPQGGGSASAYLQTSSGTRVLARYVSAAARADPRVQGRSFYYVAPASPALLGGMNVSATFSGTGAAIGAAVPDSAIVWTEGAPWVYVQVGPSTFARQRASTSLLAEAGGYLVTTIPPGTRIVVRGAQVLLSEESRSELQNEADRG